MKSIFVLFLLLGVLSPEAIIAAPSSPPFSHEIFTRLLQTYVKDGVVDYSGLRTPSARSDLDAYLAALANADPSTFATDKERLAFWLNAYNAFAIKGVLDGENASSLTGRGHFFFIKKFRVARESMTLDQMETKFVRGLFGEPRVHFALVCSSLGCPRLGSKAFNDKTLEGTLDVNTRLFIRDRSKVRLDAEQRILYLSPIFKWYEKDFGKSGVTVQEFVARYLPSEQADLLQHGPPFEIRYLDYDWSLNGR